MACVALGGMGNAGPALQGRAVRYPCGSREVAPTGKLRRDPRLRLPMPPRRPLWAAPPYTAFIGAGDKPRRYIHS